VGREADLDRLGAMLDDAQTHFVRLWGLPGVGKSTVVRALADRLREQGREVLLVETDDRWDEPARLIPEGRYDVLILDGTEPGPRLEAWVCERLARQRPGPRAVLVGRAPFPAADEPWRASVRQQEVGPLSKPASRALLRSLGVDRALHERILDLARGLPRALVLLAQELRDHRFEGERRDAVLGRLARTLAPEPAHRAQRVALRAAAIVKRLDQSLLRSMLEGTGVGEETADLFRWLRDLGCARRLDTGLTLHRAMADALFIELHQREPVLLDQLRRGALRHYAARLESMRDRSTAMPRLEAGDLVYDALYTLRMHPLVSAFGVGSTPPLRSSALRKDEIPEVLTAIARHEGREAAALARRWLEHDLGSATTHRDREGRPRTFLYTRPFEAGETGFDPVVDDLLHAVEREAPLREGERVLLARWWMSLEHGTAPDHPLQGRMISVVSEHLAFTPGVAIGAAVHPNPELWTERPDLTHELISETRLGEHRFGVLIHDWRSERPKDWFFRFVRALAGDHDARGGGGGSVAIVDRPTFDRALKDALKHLRRPESLMESALARAPFVVRRGVVPGSLRAAETLATIVVDELQKLGAQHSELLQRTYVEPAVKQLAVADDLNLPFSTYRRHLGQAIERLAARLWALEIDAATPPADHRSAKSVA
jgi:hypothetical protein